jgi:hypothetical protein
MLGLVNDFGRMNATIVANSQLLEINALAKEDCLPKGGFPKTMIFPAGGFHSK